MHAVAIPCANTVCILVKVRYVLGITTILGKWGMLDTKEPLIILDQGNS